eukprot:SAG31_NODE_3264_length_4481_cov_17.400218_3_plen_74_part_00
MRSVVIVGGGGGLASVEFAAQIGPGSAGDPSDFSGASRIFEASAEAGAGTGDAGAGVGVGAGAGVGAVSGAAA